MAIRRISQRWSTHKRRNTLVVAALSAVLIAATVGVTRAVGDEGTELTTRNVQVTTGSMQETVSASGTVAAKSTEDLNFSVSGEVVAVNVEQGDTVRKNDVLARIDSASLRAQVAQAEASVASAESKLASDEDADASSAQLNADSASLSAARSELAVAEANLASATLRSPIRGTISSLDLVVGQYVSAGSSSSGATASGGSTGTSSGATSPQTTSSTSSPQIQVISTSSYVVEASVDDTQISKLTQGDQATITVNGSTEKAFGTVSSVGLVATTSSGVSSFPVVVDVTGNPTGLHAGSTATVSIVYRQLNDVLQVSSLAISNNGGKKSVKLVTDSGIEEREVTTGVTAGATTQILTGLQDGDQVQVTIPAAVTGGARTGGQGESPFGAGQFPGGGGLPAGGPPAGFPMGGMQ